MKSELRRLLVVLNIEITEALMYDTVHRGLFTALFRVFSYIWCKSDPELEKKFKKF